MDLLDCRALHPGDSEDINSDITRYSVISIEIIIKSIANIVKKILLFDHYPGFLMRNKRRLC
jgi:hypothetical protein